MKRITLWFLTPKGEKAYHDVEKSSEGAKANMVANKVAKTKIVNKNPLTVIIKIKIKWLAVQIEFDKQIIDGLKQFGAVKNIDYYMDVE